MVLIDTSVWSLALRRSEHAQHPEAEQHPHVIGAPLRNVRRERCVFSSCSGTFHVQSCRKCLFRSYRSRIFQLPSVRTATRPKDVQAAFPGGRGIRRSRIKALLSSRRAG